MEKSIFNVHIVGLSPLMQDRVYAEDLPDGPNGGKKPTMKREDMRMSDLDKAIRAAYRDINPETKKMEYYIPAVHFEQCFIGGGTYIKAPVGNAKRSMKNMVAAMFEVYPSKIFTLGEHFDEIDIQVARNAVTGARIVKYRPRWNKWEARFELHILSTALTIPEIRQIIEVSGLYQGIGSFRPEHKGKFGKFELAPGGLVPKELAPIEKCKRGRPKKVTA